MAEAEQTATDRLRAKLALARDLLGMDIAMLTEVRDRREVARYASGGWPGVGTIEGAAIPLEETFCQKLIDGAIPNWIGDVVCDERVADLQMAQVLGAGAWIGTLVHGPERRLFVLCALSREAKRELGEPDLQVLSAFLLSILPDLAAADWPVRAGPLIERIRRTPAILVVDFAEAVTREDVDEVRSFIRAQGSGLEETYTHLTRRLAVHAVTMDAIEGLGDLERELRDRFG